MLNKKHEYVVGNFLLSMDLQLPISLNIENAKLDYKLYGWSQSILKEILDGIEDIYKNKRN